MANSLHAFHRGIGLFRSHISSYVSRPHLRVLQGAEGINLDFWLHDFFGPYG